jgi:hypothetical protein
MAMKKQLEMKWLTNTQLPALVHRAFGAKCELKGLNRALVARALVSLYVEGGAIEKAIDVWIKKNPLDGRKEIR